MDESITIRIPPVLQGQVDVAANLRRLLEQTVLVAFSKISSRAAGATSSAGYERIAQAYRVLVLGGADVEVAIQNTDENWQYVDEDTEPHEIPPHWVPIQALLEWAAAHGMDDRAAYAIQQKIAREGFMHPGTHGHYFFQQALDEDMPELWATLREVLDAQASTYGGGAR